MSGRIYPISLPQRDVYYEQLLYPESAIYNIGAKVEVRGSLDAEIFRKAAWQLVRQHDSLRSRYLTVDGKPCMEVLEDAQPFVDYLDFSESAEPLAIANEFIQKEFQQPFDLGGEQLLNRYYLVKVSEDLFYIVGKYHHLVADGWSTSLLFSRLANNYASIKEGREPDNPEPYPYSDFITEDLSYLDSEDYTADTSYWKKKFDMPELPGLSGNENSTAAEGNLDSRRKEIYLSRDFYNQIIQFSEAHSVSVFHFLLGITALYFTSVSDERRLIFGLPLLNRKNKKFKNMVGLFAGITPLLMDMRPDMTFSEVLTGIRQELRENFRHQRLPLSVITAGSGWLKGGHHRPLYQIFFSYEKHDYSMRFDGHLSTVLPLTHYQERAPLAIYVREFDDTKDVKIDFDYNINYFDASFIETCTNRLPSLIGELLADPGRCIGEIGILGAEEEQKLLREYNDTSVAYEEGLTVVDLLSAQVWRTPEGIALEYGGKRISYRELWDRVGALATYLRDGHGVGRNELVGIMMSRTERMLIGMLGIIRAGGAYVPIDPEHPAARIAHILEQSGVKVVLTDDRYRERMEGQGYRCIVLSEEHEVIGGEESEPASASASASAAEPVSASATNHAEDLLYVMYTSGSTGRPKGVEIEHRSVVNFLLSMREQLGIGASDRLLAVTTYSFDISVLELLLPLVSGGTVLLLGREDIQDAGRLVRSIGQLRPGMLQCTPGMWQMLLEAGWKGDEELRALCGGERLGKDLAGRLLGKVKELWNMYGPTETTIWSSMHRVQVAEEASCIGRPIANTELYILNGSRQLLPIGASGELYIGGRGLARGYKDQPELTGEKFVPHPFKGEGRLYRTGDVAKWRPDGCMEFVGRRDEQVKIRGYRVEPGEIEYVLSRHEAVRTSVVTAQRGSDGSNYLAAYVVLLSPVTSQELREYVRGELPEYMVPGYFISLERLPLSANGKVDRKALPGIGESELLGGGAAYEGAGSRLEGELVRIWEEVLNRERVGVRDNFFEIGGHSLRAVQILSRIHQELGVEMGLHELFNHPRIADMAKLIGDRGVKSGYEEIGVVGEQEYYEVSHAQRRLWILSRFPEGSLAYNIAGAYRMVGSLQVEDFRRSLLRVVDRHESLRTVFVTVDGLPMQRVQRLEETGFELEELDVRAAGGREVAEELAVRELETAFDLSRGPLVRAKLLRVGEEEYVFLLTLHHIITDGWSMEVLVREVMELYAAYGAGKEDPLKKLRIQYKDYAHWQNGQIRSQAMEVHREYWLNQFRGELPVLELPLDYPRPEVLISRGGKVSGKIDEALYCRLKELAGLTGGSVYALLMALTKVLLYRYTGQQDIIVGYPLSMRGYTELEGQVGLFLNAMPLRTRVEGSDSFRDVLANVKTGMLRGHQHQLYPFDKLIGSLNLSMGMERAPLFDVVVVLQNLSIHQQERHMMGNMVVEPYDIDQVTSSVDLRLEFIERADHIVTHFEFNRGLFKVKTIQTFMDRFFFLLNRVLDEPDTPIENIGFENEREFTRTDPLSNHFTLTF